MTSDSAASLPLRQDQLTREQIEELRTWFLTGEFQRGDYDTLALNRLCDMASLSLAPEPIPSVVGQVVASLHELEILFRHGDVNSIHNGAAEGVMRDAKQMLRGLSAAREAVLEEAAKIVAKYLTIRDEWLAEYNQRNLLETICKDIRALKSAAGSGENGTE